MNKRLTFTFLAALFVTAACGSDSSSYSAADVVDQAPQGQMDGAAWAMRVASVDEGFDEDELSIKLYAEDVEACGFGIAADSSILFNIPRMEGEYPLSFSFGGGDNRTVTFSPGPGQNVIASDGVIVVDALSDTEVTVGIVATAGDSEINGRFTATICGDD